MRCAVIDLSTGLVANVIVARAASIQPQAGWLFVDSDTAGIGDRWIGAEIAPTLPGAGTPTENPGISAL